VKSGPAQPRRAAVGVLVQTADPGIADPPPDRQPPTEKCQVGHWKGQEQVSIKQQDGSNLTLWPGSFGRQAGVHPKLALRAAWVASH